MLESYRVGTVKEVSVRGIIAVFAGALILILVIFVSSATAFEPGSIGLSVGGGMNVPVLDFADQSALAASIGFGFTAKMQFQLTSQLAIAGYYDFRHFDTHFTRPPTGYTGGYATYRLHTFLLNPRLYLGKEMPCSFIEVGPSGYIPYFYIPGDQSNIDMLPSELAFGVNFGYGWHTDKNDLIIRYNIFKTDRTTQTPETFIHYLTFDALLNVIPGK